MYKKVAVIVIVSLYLILVACSQQENPTHNKINEEPIADNLNNNEKDIICDVENLVNKYFEALIKKEYKVLYDLLSLKEQSVISLNNYLSDNTKNEDPIIQKVMERIEYLQNTYTTYEIKNIEKLDNRYLVEVLFSEPDFTIFIDNAVQKYGIHNWSAKALEELNKINDSSDIIFIENSVNIFVQNNNGSFKISTGRYEEIAEAKKNFENYSEEVIILNETVDSFEEVAYISGIIKNNDSTAFSNCILKLTCYAKDNTILFERYINTNSEKNIEFLKPNDINFENEKEILKPNYIDTFIVEIERSLFEQWSGEYSIDIVGVTLANEKYIIETTLEYVDSIDITNETKKYNDNGVVLGTVKNNSMYDLNIKLLIEFLDEHGKPIFERVAQTYLDDSDGEVDILLPNESGEYHAIIKGEIVEYWSGSVNVTVYQVSK